MRLYLDNLVVEKEGNEIRILISDIKCLIVDNNKANLSTQLINALTDNNVSVVICNLSHLPSTLLLPLSGNYASSGVISKQIMWDSSLKSKLHKEIVKGKIQSQIEILLKNDKSMKVISKLRNFMEEVTIGDETNREGLAAKVYFKEMFGKDFIRFEEDIINAGLNYGYAIFRSLISSIIVSKGLLLSLGIFHKGSQNSYNLADDIIEVYRPLVDDYVFNNMLNEEILTSKNKEGLIRLMDKKIEYNDQLQTITNSIELYVESIIRCFDEKSIEHFVSPSLRRIVDI